MKRIALLIALAALVCAQGAVAQTLKTVKDRGMLNCGANGTLAGFGLPDAQGKWTGLDVDFCRAVAAAVLGDPNKVKFVPLSAKDRFTALQSGEVDVLVRNTTWTSSRDTSLGLNFVWDFDSPNVVSFAAATGSCCRRARSSSSPSVRTLSSAAVGLRDVTS